MKLEKGLGLRSMDGVKQMRAAKDNAKAMPVESNGTHVKNYSA